MSNNIKLEIEDFLGFVDMNGVDALDSEQVEKLENYIYACNRAMNDLDSAPLVVDAVWDKLVSILKQANPDSEVLKEVWSDDEVPVEDFEENDLYKHLREEPMRSINTCKSYDCDELMQFVQRLPEDEEFSLHASVKLNGHGIRVVYCYGLHEDSTSRARNSAGHNLKKQLDVVLAQQNVLNIEDLEELDNVEVRGELVLPFRNLAKAREYNPNIVSAFSGVSSMLRDSATPEEWGLLEFVAYKIIGDGFVFETKEDEYDLLESLGFKTPLSWVIDGITKENILDELPNIIKDCEEVVAPDENGENGYDYFSDGIVVEVNSREIFNKMGCNGSKYYFGNVAMKVGYWKQDLYSGFVQTILWTRGKQKYSPVAIVADEPNMIIFEDGGLHPYISDIKEINSSNWKELGVITAGGNRVRRVPLYEPNNILLLNAYINEVIFFRYGGEAGVVPCFPDGKPLTEGKIKQVLKDEDEDYFYDPYAEEYEE